MHLVAFLKIIFSFFTMLAFVFPLILINEIITPWSEAKIELSRLYPSNVYLALESKSEEETSSPSGDITPAYKMKSYLVIPSNKTIRFTKKADDKVAFEEVGNFTVTYLLINAFLLTLFFFLGLPILKKLVSGKLISKRV
ncbi:hypothetical protein [Colwellia sp. BRX9-1]|uniref:hypothetical protein n=1 Tax=Colwellia sp. BRX9-1 TaxID=2759830 RepID=UPI0015F416B7|nr:hypothetical protein [Colwellia sp. BRX9-1]MBA6354200.1 hypothetical protein [Colwellia sp. BRX9-1]